MVTEETSPRSASGLGQARPKGPPPAPSVQLTTPTRLTTTMRGSLPANSDDDDVDTLWLDRAALDIAVLPDARHAKNLTPAAKEGPQLPVAGFHPRGEAARHDQGTTFVVRRPRGGGLPLGVWLLAAVIAAIVSFHFAPQAREGLGHAVRALDAR